MKTNKIKCLKKDIRSQSHSNFYNFLKTQVKCLKKENYSINPQQFKTMQQNLGYNSGLQRSLRSQIQQRTEEYVRVHRRLFFKCLVN